MSEKGGQQVGPSVGPIARMKQQNRDLIAQMKIFVQMKQENRDLKAEVEQLKKELELYHDVDDENRDLKLQIRSILNNGADDLLEMKKHYEAEVERLKKEAFDYRDGFMETSTELENLRELQKAAEDIDLIPADWVHEDLRPKISALHKAIRKVRGME